MYLALCVVTCHSHLNFELTCCDFDGTFQKLVDIICTGFFKLVEKGRVEIL